MRIGDDVEIGANTCIDRGALDDTVIEDGVKLDNLIQIGHNVHIGAHTAMAGCVGIAGSTRIGKRTAPWAAARIVLGHLTLADHVHISARHGGDALDPPAGQYSGVFPIDDNAAWEKNAATLRQLHTLRERIRALEKQRPRRDNHEDDGHPPDPQEAAAPLPDPAGGPRARAREGPAHQGDQERHHQRGTSSTATFRAAGDARRADDRGAGAGLGAAGLRDRWAHARRRIPCTTSPASTTRALKRPVEPGDQLVLEEATLERAKSSVYKFKARALVGDELAVEADLMCTMRSFA